MALLTTAQLLILIIPLADTFRTPPSLRPIIVSTVQRQSTHLRMSTDPQQQSQPSPLRIFCYGDSLTAGTAPPLDGLFPYGPHLEQELNAMYSESQSSTSCVVRWRGLPGWTSSTMNEYLDDGNTGLRSAVSGIRNPSLSLVIIFAGTNDIGFLTSSMAATSPDVDEAVAPILSLHKACLDCEPTIHTLSVSIPGSNWQEVNQSAAKLCADMNGALQQFATSNDRVSHVEFPFAYQRGDAKWSADGLHLSPEGYETLGRSLAGGVKQILDGLQ